MALCVRLYAWIWHGYKRKRLEGRALVLPLAPSSLEHEEAAITLSLLSSLK